MQNIKALKQLIELDLPDNTPYLLNGYLNILMEIDSLYKF